MGGGITFSQRRLRNAFFHLLAVFIWTCNQLLTKISPFLPLFCFHASSSFLQAQLQSAPVPLPSTFAPFFLSRSSVSQSF